MVEEGREEGEDGRRRLGRKGKRLKLAEEDISLILTFHRDTKGFVLYGFPCGQGGRKGGSDRAST